MEDNGSGFFVALAALTILTAIAWFVLWTGIVLAVGLVILGLLVLSPWIIQGFVEGWRAGRS